MTVYSKDKGIIRRETPRPTGDRAPSYRQSPSERVQVPPNYSGHAIVDGEERPLGSLFSPEADTPQTSELPAAEQPTPRFDGLPRVSDLGDVRRHQPRTLPPPVTVAEEAPTSSDGRSDEPPSRDGDTAPADRGKPASTEPTPTPPERSLPAHAPCSLTHSFLGNGLGLEELLLLGLILFLLREGEGGDRGDLDETVLLLGLLLLLG